MIRKIKNELKENYYKYRGNFKKRKLKCDDFSIISNNCFGGRFYKDNNLQYRSPTCGLAFIAEDYIKFINNMEHYLKIDDMKELSIEESKYCNYLKLKQYSNPIGKLDDIELLFFHYDTFGEAKEKWNRRKSRINMNKLIYKFNDQNLCTYKELEEFNKFPAKNKICFTAKKYDEFDTIQLKQYEKYAFVISDTQENDYKKYFDMYEFINKRFS